MTDPNISDQLPKLYLFHSLNRTMCGGDMSPYSVSGAKPQPPNVFLDIIRANVSPGCRPPFLVWMFCCWCIMHI